MQKDKWLMQENWNRSIDFVLDHEGDYTNNPNDPGGETNYGISKRWHPDLDIKNLTREQAIAIYRGEYWLRNDCDERDWPWDILVFDTAVNMGRGTARALVRESFDWKDFIIRRMKRYVDLKGQVMEGWINRTYDLYELIFKREYSVK